MATGAPSAVLARNSNLPFVEDLPLPDTLPERLGQEPEGLGDEGLEPFEGDKVQGLGIEDDGVGPGAVLDLDPVHGADDVRQPRGVAAADETNDPRAGADPLGERFPDLGMEVGPDGRGLAADLVKDDLAVAGQVEGFVPSGRPAGRADVDVVFLGDEAIPVSGGKIEQEDLGHGPAPSINSGLSSD